MKKIIHAVVLLCTLYGCGPASQKENESVPPDTIGSTTTTSEKLYNEQEDPFVKLENLKSEALASHKNIILQVGGNWCIWCHRFEKYRLTTPAVKAFIDKNFIFSHINYSEGNTNDSFLTAYKFDGGLGYPSFIILDAQGEIIGMESSGPLEDGAKGYDEARVLGFLEKYAPRSL